MLESMRLISRPVRGADRDDAPSWVLSLTWRGHIKALATGFLRFGSGTGSLAPHALAARGPGAITVGFDGALADKRNREGIRPLAGQLIRKNEALVDSNCSASYKQFRLSVTGDL